MADLELATASELPPAGIGKHQDVSSGLAGRDRTLRARRFVIVWCIRLAIVGAFVGAWQISVSLHWANELLVGTPAGTLSAFWTQLSTSVLTVDLPTTLYEVGVGLLISVASGVSVGLFLVTRDTLRTAISPILTGINSLPRVALAPLFIIWFGLGPAGKIALVISFVFFVMFTATVSGFAQSERDFVILSRSLGANRLQELIWIGLPGALPTMIGGLELSLVYSFLAAITGELVGGEHGLGVDLATDANAFHIDQFMAILMLLVLVTVIPMQLIRILTNPLLRWHRTEAGGEADDH